MKKKSLIMLACALMIVSSMAFGTIAYLTDQAGVTNRFTVGNVDIVVDETEVDKNGDPVPNDPADPDSPSKRTEDKNEYPLTPSSKYVKDPTMTVKAGSEAAFVRMVVTISNASEIDAIFADLKTQYPAYAAGFVPGDFVTGRDNTKWISTGAMAKDDAANTYTLEFRYFEAVKPTDTEDVVLPALFETIRIPGELTNEHLAKLENFTIDVFGNAIQTTGFESAADAWTAFDAQMTATSAGSTET